MAICKSIMNKNENPSRWRKNPRFVLSYETESRPRYWETRFYGKLKQILSETEERPFHDEIPR